MTGRALPSGIVAFVFSDIEGSTRLFRSLGEGYVAVLERHDTLLRRAWAGHDGVVVKTEGDGFFVAFERVGDALRACSEAQQLLASEPWPDGIDLRVRMGIHAGLAYPRGEDYVALAVHQASRVAAAAHGRQILLSSSAADLLDDADRASLRALGAYRIRDFDEPVQLFMTGDSDPSLPVRALPAERHNLSPPHTSFLGRTDQLDEVAGLLGPGRLVTIVGPGGVGKTRLAVELGLRVAPDWGDGVWFVDLSSLEDATRIPDAVAVAIGAGIPAHADAWSVVVDHLRERHALLILDTSEHLSEGVAARTGSLIASCPGIAILATSRIPLGAPGEQLFRLGPLGTEGGAVSPAAELFIERARMVDPSFDPRADERAIIEAICRRVDGLPLAIELAAARIGVIAPHEILDGLADPFGVLRTRDTTVPERHRTLDGLIAWSERLLSPEERSLLHRLGLFAGSFGLAESSALTDASIPAADLADLVWSLAESSLIVAVRHEGSTRYRLLDSVQAYAKRQLAAEGALTQTAERLGRWYVERHFQAGRFDRDRLTEFQVSLDNVRGILGILIERAPEVAQWLTAAIGEQYVLATRFRGGAEELGRLVERLPERTPAGVYMSTVYADLLLWAGDEAAADRVLTRAEQLRSQVGSPSDSTDWSIAYDRADLARRAGDVARAIEVAEAALEEPGDAGRSRMLNLLGIIYYERGEMEESLRCFIEGLEVDRRVRHDQNVAIAHANIAETALALDRLDVSARHALDALTVSREMGMSVTLAMAIATAAHLSARDDPIVAVQLAAHAQLIYETDGFTPAADEQGPTIQQLYEDVATRRGEDAVDAARAAGRELPLTEAIALADEVLSSRLRAPAPQA